MYIVVPSLNEDTFRVVKVETSMTIGIYGNEDDARHRCDILNDRSIEGE